MQNPQNLIVALLDETMRMVSPENDSFRKVNRKRRARSHNRQIFSETSFRDFPKTKGNKQMKAITNLIYSALALFAFASFAVTAKGADPEFGKEISHNNWEIATRFEDNVQCAGGHVTVGGKLKVEFEVHTRADGRKVVVPKTVEINGGKFLPKDASNGVGATGEGNLTYRVD